MTIQDLGNLGELVAAIATVATLAYLAVQIRQNTATNRTNSAASQNQTDLSIMLLLAQDADVNRIFFEGLAGTGELTDADVRRLDAAISAQLANSQRAWRFAIEGAIDEEQWTAQLAFLRWMSQQPGFGRWWQRWRSTLPTSFQEIVGRAMTETTEVPVELPTAPEAAPQDKQ